MDLNAREAITLGGFGCMAATVPIIGLGWLGLLPEDLATAAAIGSMAIGGIITVGMCMESFRGM